ncbi:uncharacterized protein LOC126777078 isoform X2 [Nymphalis io]|uniref:uncharacterized protein LOC126777078 isoform X2 n=1 Tax=Inachis io TaxID=171585 RepID=UPI002169B887|nr:uncharacterized protein LOC126777078 isoform X2 [Nymphalis io]
MGWIVLIISIIFVPLWEVETLISNLQKPCVPSASVKGPCHKCFCNSEAVFECHATACQRLTIVNPNKYVKDECQPHMTYKFEEIFCICNYEGKWMSSNCRDTFQYLRPNEMKPKDTLRSNITSTVRRNVKHSDLPQIQKGQSCVPGKLYIMSCNTCRCGDNAVLLCTKMACFENTILKGFRDLRKYERNENVKIKIDNKSNKQSEKKPPKKNSKKLPELPEGDCVPGKIYRKGCNKCFCNDQKVASCTKICGKVSYRVNDEEIAQIEARSPMDIPMLPHMGAECEPGKVYQVSCNLCFCSEAHNLLCTMKYCLNVNNYAEIHANKLKGKPCTNDYTELCSECKCVNNKSECKAIKRCSGPSNLQMLSSAGAKIKLTLDVKKDNCEPLATYKIHCNECYCQSDGTLRCTQKVCLNYSQTKHLQERESYLEKHGL